MSSKEKLEERSFIVECIQVYESLPAIWDVKSKDYSNRDKKRQQYEVLLEKFKEKHPTADKAEVIRKFNSLRTNFRKELKRISDSERSGAGADDVCEPTLWYFDDMKFLTSSEEPCTSMSSMNKENADSGESQLKDKPPTKRHKKDEPNELISLACKRLSEPKNEYRTISTTWANELAKMEPGQQLFAKKAINEILFEGQMGTLHRYSVQINKNENTSTPYNSILDPDIVYEYSQEEILGEEN